MTYDISMISAVEARSLSSITSIASSLPDHPTQHLGAHQPPLTLYIARVPGSRDVFLTPLKPRDKTVTAEDVQSSLYYVHFNSDSDVDMLLEETGSPTITQDMKLSATTKKSPPPLPARPARQIQPINTIENANVKPVLPPRPSSISRKPIFSDITNIGRPKAHPLPPLPPRPSQASATFEESIAASVDARQTSYRQSQVNDNPYALPTPREVSDQEALTGSLTLIRRDPGTSDQWNVARIHDPPVQEVSSINRINTSLADRRVKKSGAPLYLDILNPAYSAFADHSSASEHAEQDVALRRRLYLPGSRNANHSYINASQSRFSASFAEHQNIPAHRSRSSVDEPLPQVDWRNKGYSFSSPWNGKCEFHTSSSGRSLKCRHWIDDRDINDDEISELRFNLPVSSRGTSTITTSEDKRRSVFDPLQSRLKSGMQKLDQARGSFTNPRFGDEDDSDVEDRLDLSLGQERAGGGLGGKRVKLGKLIIHPGGMVMLDLLVAANVALWWRAWEKVG